MTEAEIKAKYIRAHKELEKQYYKYSLISEEEFVQLHGQNWDDMEAELIAGGYRIPPEPPLVFEPPPGTGVPERVEYIEQYLKELQRRESE